MRILGLALAGLLVTVALAGCSDDGDGDSSNGDSNTGVPITYSDTPTSAPTTSASGTSSSSSTSTGPGANRAPTAAITAAVEGTNVTFSLSGSDPDGDTLVWDLEFGDGNTTSGTTLPSTVTHSYAVGDFTATFSVTDGQQPTTATAAVSIAAAAPAAFFDQTKPWTVSAGGVVEFAFGCEADGEDCAFFAFGAAGAGRPYTLTFSATVPAAVYYIDNYSGGTYVDTLILEPPATEVSGTVPAGIDEFRTYATGGAMFEAHLLIP